MKAGATTKSTPAVHDALPATEQLLIEGGDARIALNPDGMNRYGCPPFPDPELVALGSSTASGISTAGFAAADRLRSELLRAMRTESAADIYTRELNRVRQELNRLCGISALPGIETIVAASGTDAHLFVAQLVSGDAMPVLAIMVEAAESGSGVPAALAGLRPGEGRIEVATVPIRLADGTPRQAAEVDAEFEMLVGKALANGQRVLLVLTDASKTGIIAPSPDCALRLHRNFPDMLDVLVDACQFRIAPATLCAYLEQNFMVALTGSKFVSGPPFSGALLVPAQLANRFRMRPFPVALSGSSFRADWPSGWNIETSLTNSANFGLLLRWEAALEELRAFRSIPEAEVGAFLQEFANAIQDCLARDPALAALPTPALVRSPLVKQSGWDHIQTIFPFLLLHPETRRPLSLEQTRRAYRLLQFDLGPHDEFQLGDVASLRCQFGQPVACGIRNSLPVGALRLCISARLVVEATAQNGRNLPDVVHRALAALKKASLLARTGLAQPDLLGTSRAPRKITHDTGGA